jgi:hypothetical protein
VFGLPIGSVIGEPVPRLCNPRVMGCCDYRSAGAAPGWNGLYERLMRFDGYAHVLGLGLRWVSRESGCVDFGHQVTTEGGGLGGAFGTERSGPRRVPGAAVEATGHQDWYGILA